MSQRIHHITVESFVQTKGKGMLNFDQSIQRLRALCEVWNKNESQNVLVDLRERTFELVPAEIKKIVEITAKTGLGQDNKVALIYRHRGPYDAPLLLEFIAKGMGLNVKAFEDYEAAVEWLVSTKTLAAHYAHD